MADESVSAAIDPIRLAQPDEAMAAAPARMSAVARVNMNAEVRVGRPTYGVRPFP